MDAIAQAGASGKTAGPARAAVRSIGKAEEKGFREAMELKLKGRGEDAIKPVETAKKGKDAEKKVDDRSETAGAFGVDVQAAEGADAAKAVVSVGVVSLPAVGSAAVASAELPGSGVAKTSARKIERGTNAPVVAKKEESGVKGEGLHAEDKGTTGLAGVTAKPDAATKEMTAPLVSAVAALGGSLATRSPMVAAVKSSLKAPTETATVVHAGATPREEVHMLAAAPNVLEVGLASGAHGWLRVRAELGTGGELSAQVVTASAGAAESLHRELPALAAYLASEQVGLSSLTVNATEAGAGAQDAAMSSGAGWDGSGSDGGGSARDGSRAGDGQATVAMSSDDGSGFEALAVGLGGPGFGIGTLRAAGSGGWLSVRV